ncbi:hypothetical protein [Thalassobacillus hwangdonensis]
MSEDREKQVIEQYRRGEKMMILIFAQWCVNNELNAVELYEHAYPQQKGNKELLEAMELTVPKKESEEIANDTLLEALSVYGNEDLAFVVTQYM